MRSLCDSRPVLHRLNARQSDNFIEFLRNALSQPPESILSSFRIAKRLGKRVYLFRLWHSITQFDTTVHCGLTYGHVQYARQSELFYIYRISAKSLLFSFCYYYQTSRFYRISTLFPLAYFVDTVIYTFLTTKARVVQACHLHFTSVSNSRRFHLVCPSKQN